MNWRSEPRTIYGVTERDFELRVDDRMVPAVLWTPERITAPVPLVLLGYGGGGHKRDGSRMWQGGWYAQRGIAAASIDLPGHGERALPNGERPDYGLILDNIIAEWRACLDTLLIALPEIDGARVAYRGMSMGTMLGLPLVAAEPRIRAALFSGADLRDVPGLFTGIGTRLAHDAPLVRCAVLFGVAWNDEVVDRQSAFELFGLLGTPDKEMHVSPGGHTDVRPGATEAGMQFLVERLLAD